MTPFHSNRSITMRPSAKLPIADSHRSAGWVARIVAAGKVPRVASFLAVLLMLSIGAVSVDAATTYKSYSGSFAGGHGTTKVTVYTNRAGSISLSLKAMAPGTWAVAIWRGTCSSPSARIVTLPSIEIGSSGAAARTNRISTTIMTRLKGYKAAIRVTRVSSVVCASVATISVAAAAVRPSAPSNCHPSYRPVCLIQGIGDYDCASGSGNGPNYVAGPFYVVGYDEFDLDRDGDGIGCENG